MHLLITFICPYSHSLYDILVVHIISIIFTHYYLTLLSFHILTYLIYGALLVKEKQISKNSFGVTEYR